MLFLPFFSIHSLIASSRAWAVVFPSLTAKALSSFQRESLMLLTYTSLFLSFIRNIISVIITISKSYSRYKEVLLLIVFIMLIIIGKIRIGGVSYGEGHRA